VGAAPAEQHPEDQPLNLTPFDELKRQQQQALRAARPAILTGSRPPEGPESPSPDSLGFLETAGDYLAAPLRGLEGAVQDVYGLADTLTFDALPDYEERVFGESRTRIGGLIEGITNFGAGFVGAGFIPLGWTSKLGRLSGVAKAAFRGAVADFAVFDGHEERLSNLIQSFPGLANPINGFLAAKEDDPEIVGRLKNALEGVGVGLLVDGVVGSLKALKAGRLARAAGEGSDAVEAAMDKAVPPDELEKAWGRGAEATPPPEPGALGAPALPEAAEAGKPLGGVPGQAEAEVVSQPKPEALAAPRGPVQQEILQTMGVSPEKAQELYTEARRRQHGGGELLDTTLDPRVNPRKLSPAERFAQGMLQTDLNLSAYQGPEGGLQLLRATEQLMEPFRGVADASRRTLSQQEDASFRELADMIGEGNPHRLMVSMQRDVQTLAALNDRVRAYKTALQAQGEYVYRAAKKAWSPNGTDKDILEALDGHRTLNEMVLGVKTLGSEQGRGLGANRIPTRYFGDLFDRSAIDEALHEVGGRKRAIDILNKYRTLWESTADPLARAAKGVALAQGFSGRRAMGILNEYWYNALLGRPTTAVVNGMSNALMTVYKPLELIAGGAVLGNGAQVADGVRELQALSSSASEAWRAMKASLSGEGQLLDPKAVFSDVQNLNRSAIEQTAQELGKDTIHGQALSWVGRLVNYPSKVLTATDQFFQQLNYRAVARAQLTKEALMNPAIGREGAAAFVTAEMDKLIHRGQAYGTAQLYARGVEEGASRGLRSKVAVDEYAREYVRKQLESPAHARLSSLAQIAQQRAQEATFSAPLAKGTIGYDYQELVLKHPLLRLITPFVKTPVNIAKAGYDRSVGPIVGAAQLFAARRFPALAQGLESSKNRLVQDMLSGDARRSSDAIGRASLGISTTTLVLTLAAQEAEDGMPLLTGRGPSDKETRQLLEEAGWQPYSIRIGNEYVAYGRLDPFASIIGTAADITNYIKFAAAEDQSTAEDLTYGLAISLANNFTNKTYLSGLANFFDMMHDPQRGFPVWARTLGASFVPGQAAAIKDVVDPNLRDVRSILDAARARWPGASDDLPPMRNVLGEPVRRAQSLGSGVSSVANAFVPILYREVSDDGIRKELAKLAHGFTPPKRTRGGLDLTTVVNAKGQNAFDRWLELHGEVKLGARGDLRKALGRMFESKAYQKIPWKSTDELASPRIGMVQGVIDDYRAAAFRQLLREYPELGAAERQRVDRKAQLLRGNETRPALLQALSPR